MNKNPPPEFARLLAYLSRLPAMQQPINHGKDKKTGHWWVDFSLDIRHPLAWNVVQELGFVLNYISLDERLPTVFMPISPPPYLNGGPTDFLRWVIQSQHPDMTPDLVAEILAARLPNPVDDLSQWHKEDDEGEYDDEDEEDNPPSRPPRD